MYCWYIRNMYLENNLRRSEQVDDVRARPSICGRVDLPAYVLATVEDHIVPWRSAYRTTGLFGGDTRFVLGASGHIAGVINPASKNKTKSIGCRADRCEDPARYGSQAQRRSPVAGGTTGLPGSSPRRKSNCRAHATRQRNLYPPEGICARPICEGEGELMALPPSWG